MTSGKIQSEQRQSVVSETLPSWKWDVVIVGAGLASGLTALSILARVPDCKLLIVERASYLPRWRAQGLPPLSSGKAQRGPQPRPGFFRRPLPSIIVAWPTRTPLTSLMLFHLPGARDPILMPRSLRRLRAL